MLRKVDHKNIVKIKEVHETFEEIIIVQEFIPGGTLRKVISNGILKRENLLKIIQQMIDLLEYLNDIRVVHRDFKPENFMLRPDGSSIVLIDFGLACFYSDTKKLERAAGTIGYIAPEILSKKRILPNKIDMFSAGCIIHEM